MELSRTFGQITDSDWINNVQFVALICYWLRNFHVFERVEQAELILRKLKKLNYKLHVSQEVRE